MKAYLANSILCFFLFATACSFSGNDKKENGGNRQQEISREDLVRANQFLVGNDMDLINAYTSRRNWDLDFTGTGLGYQVYERGNGPEIKRGNTVSLEYTLSLLDGTICYASENEGLKVFRVGQGGVESGLEEGVLMLRQGDKARFVLPPFLGHGLIGDRERIPPRAVLIYEVEVVKVSGR
jgi:hypothetical protein